MLEKKEEIKEEVKEVKKDSNLSDAEKEFFKERDEMIADMKK